MLRKSIAIACFTVTVSATTAGLHAAATDYSFRPVKQELAVDDSAPILVKLVDGAGKPVAGASIIRARLDMAPDNMAQHTAEVEIAPGAEPGVYAFKASFSMTGRWRLSLAAKAPGEPETITSKIVFNVK